MKRILRIFFYGVAFGLIMLAIQIIFNIDEDIIMQYYWVFAAIIIVGAAVINISYYYFYINKMKTLINMLAEGKAEEFISEVESIIPTLKNKHLKNNYILNLSAGYCDAKDYEKANTALNSLNYSELSALEKDVYNINSCAIFFYLQQEESALKVYYGNNEAFDKLRKTTLYGGNIYVLDIFADLAEGKYETAREKLKEAIDKFADPRLKSDFDYLLGKVGG